MLRRVRSLIQAIAVAISGFFVGALLISLSTIFLSNIGIQLQESPGIRLFMSTVLIQGVAFGTVALGYLSFRGLGRDFLNVRIPNRKDVFWMVGGFVVFIILYLLITMVISALGLSVAENEVAIVGQQAPTVLLLLVPLSILLVGPGEELLFRGMVQGLLDRDFSTPWAIGLASTIFAVSHAGSLQGSGQITYMIVVFVLALVLGVVYERTENLVVPAVIHGTYNAVLFGSMYLGVI